MRDWAEGETVVGLSKRLEKRGALIPGQDNELVSLQILPFPVQLYPAASFLTIDEKKLIASGWPVDIMMGSP